GREGCIAIYRCFERALQRKVVAKVFAGCHPDRRDEFNRYQKLIGLITSHPNIVGVLQLGETAHGYPYAIAECRGDMSLDEWIRQRGPLSQADALGVAGKKIGRASCRERT